MRDALQKQNKGNFGKFFQVLVLKSLFVVILTFAIKWELVPSSDEFPNLPVFLECFITKITFSEIHDKTQCLTLNFSAQDRINPMCVVEHKRGIIIISKSINSQFALTIANLF